MRGPFEPIISGIGSLRPRQDDEILRLPEPALERHPLAGERAPDDLERLLEARDAVVVGQAERAVLGLVPAGAEPEDEPAAAHLLDRRRHLRDQPGRMERGAGDERAELDTLGDRRQRGEHRPDLPRPALLTAVAAVEQVVAEPDRVEALLLGRAGHRGVLRPAGLVLDLGELDADPQARLFAMCSRYDPEPCVASFTST